MYSSKSLVIKCDFIKCQERFHVSCAQNIDLINQADIMNLLSYGTG